MQHVPTPIYIQPNTLMYPHPNMGNTCAQNNGMKFLHQ